MDEPHQGASSLTEALQQAVKDKHRFFAARAAVSAGVLCLLLGAAAVVVDIVVAFGPAGRWTAFALVLSALACMLLARCLLPSLHYREHAAVRDIESACQSVGQLIRTSADVAHHGTGRGFSTAFSEALMRDAAQAIEVMPRDRLVPWQRVRRLGTVLALVALGFALVAIVWPDFRKGAVRLALPAAPVTFTQLEMALSADRFERGQSVAVSLSVSGRPADDVELRIRPVGGEWRSQPLVEVSKGRWGSTVTGWTESFELKAAAGDDRTAPRVVTFVDPPKVLEADATLEYPDYTGLTTKTVPLHRVVAVERTVVHGVFRLNHALESARIEPVGDGEAMDLDAGTDSLSCRLTAAAGVKTYRLRGKDSKGEPLKPFVWEIKGVPDQPPTLTFVTPKEDIELTKLGELAIDILVEDDMGLAAADIVLTIDGSERTIAELAPSKKLVRQEHLVHYLMLEQLPVYPGCNMRLHARARDHHPTRSGWAVSDIRLIEVRPLKILQQPREQQPEAEQPSAEQLQEQLATLDDAIQQHKEVLQETLRRREQTPQDSAPMAREAQTEEQLAQTMNELMQQAGQQQPQSETGTDQATAAHDEAVQDQQDSQSQTAAAPNNPLQRAAEELEQAAEELVKPSIPEAFRREDLAMAEMLEARQALQEQLDQATQQQQANAQQSAQQQQQQEPESLESLAERAAELARQERDIGQQMMAQMQQRPQGQTESESAQKEQQPQAGEQQGQSAEQQPRPEEPQAQSAAPSAPAGAEQRQDPQSQAEQELPQTARADAPPTPPEENAQAGETVSEAPRQQADAREQQRQAVAEAIDLEADVAEHPQTTPLAEERMREVRQRMEEAMEALARQDDPAATEDLAQAEEQLDELAHHLRGLDPALAADTLERASRMAREAADDLQGLDPEAAETPDRQESRESDRQARPQADESTSPSPPSPTEPQPQSASSTASADEMPQSPGPHEQRPAAAGREQIARDAETMDDWLRQLSETFTPGMESTQRELRRVRQEMQTETMAEEVRRAETDRGLGRPEEAERRERDVAERLQNVAESLEQERERLVRTRLEQLAAAEQEARRLQEETGQNDKPRNQQGQSAAERLRDFADDLQALRDRELEQHAREIREQVGPQNVTGGPQQGDMIPESVHRETLPGTEGRLRELIDDIVRREMLVDRDARVPENYQPLVESYFQALSDDQR